MPAERILSIVRLPIDISLSFLTVLLPLMKRNSRLGSIVEFSAAGGFKREMPPIEADLVSWGKRIGRMAWELPRMQLHQIAMEASIRA